MFPRRIVDASAGRLTAVIHTFAIRAKIEKASFRLDFVELALDLREALILKRIERPHGQDRGKQDPLRWDSPCGMAPSRHGQIAAFDQMVKSGRDLAERLAETSGNFPCCKVVRRLFVVHVDERSFQDVIQNIAREPGEGRMVGIRRRDLLIGAAGVAVRRRRPRLLRSPGHELLPVKRDSLERGRSGVPRWRSLPDLDFRARGPMQYQVSDLRLPLPFEHKANSMVCRPGAIGPIVIEEDDHRSCLRLVLLPQRGIATAMPKSERRFPTQE